MKEATARIKINLPKKSRTRSRVRQRLCFAQSICCLRASINKIIKTEHVAPVIHWIRQEKVKLDRDLAALYGVETRTLKQTVPRNSRRFPEDFMFVLSPEEFANWRSQNVISKSDRMGLRRPPMAFTEQGVAMLSSVLRSERAAEVNIAIMRTFVQLRRLVDIVAEIEAEQALIAANRELVTRMEKNIQATLARVWGGDDPTLAEVEA